MSTFEAKEEVSAAPAPSARNRDGEIAALMAAPSHVYFVYSAGLVKIGFSTDWLSRTDTVCRGCPHEGYVILVMPGDRKMEAAYHALFDEYRSVGEWFRCEGKMREFLVMFSSDEGREALAHAEESFREWQDDCDDAALSEAAS